MSETEAASDLSTRFAAGVVMIAVASAAIYVGGWPFRLLVAAGAAVMLIEWGDMHRVRRGWSWLGVALLIAATLILAEQLFPVARGDQREIGRALLEPIWVGFGAIAVLGILYGLFTRRLAMGWGLIYVAIPAFTLIVLNWAWFELVFWLMLVTWSTDIFAYFAGRGIGGPKLAPRISPNKTWAGLIGGMAGAALVGAVAARAFELDPIFYVAGAPMGFLAQMGDLYESRVKRRLGFKDSGSILPGHGGILDRVDGLLPVSVATLALLMLILA